MDVPADYQVRDLGIAYTNLVGPLHRAMRDGREWLGLRIEERHTNGGPIAHGGLVSGLADIVMGRAATFLHKPPRLCLSVSLYVDFLSSAPVGCWLEAVATPDRMGQSMAFMSCQIYADGQLAAIGRGVLKYLSTDDERPQGSGSEHQTQTTTAHVIKRSKT